MAACCSLPNFQRNKTPAWQLLLRTSACAFQENRTSAVCACMLHMETMHAAAAAELLLL
jgi:hypothetical protein